jgi:hypothetical protein
LPTNDVLNFQLDMVSYHLLIADRTAIDFEKKARAENEEQSKHMLLINTEQLQEDDHEF